MLYPYSQRGDIVNRPCAFVYKSHLSVHVFISNYVSGYLIDSPANDHDVINIKMFSSSLSVDGTIKLTNSLHCTDNTHTFYEAIEEFLTQNHMAGLFEIDPQHMKV